jgi:hypothetical protein
MMRRAGRLLLKLTMPSMKVMPRADYEHGADYDWICPTCFADLNDTMRWSEAAAGSIEPRG